MVYIEPYVSPRILRAIKSNGGKATSREISKLADLKGGSVNSSGTWLKNWGLLKKKKITIMELTKEGKKIPHRLAIYSLNEKRMKDIERVINKIPKGWTK